MKHPLSMILEHKGNKVFHVSPSDSVADAICAMNDNNIGAVVVMDGKKLVGIFTERDVLRKACFRSLDDMKSTLVKDMMTDNLVTGTLDTTVEEAIAIYTNKRFRHLPILDNGELVGMVSSGDVTKWVMEHQQDEIDHLSDYIAGEHHGIKPGPEEK